MSTKGFFDTHFAGRYGAVDQVALGLPGDELRKFFGRSGDEPREDSGFDEAKWADADPGKPDWFVFRIVAKGWGTLTQVQNEWSFVDVVNAHQALNDLEEAERQAHAQARR